jgi:metallo-beta-lactamase class B
MSARLVALAVLLLAGCAPVAPVARQSDSRAHDSRAQGTALSKACEGRDGWSDAAPPARVFGNTYYVGTCGIAVLLIVSPKGHVLVDSATAEAVPSILANIRKLGFDPRDIKFLVGSHEHVDHMGGFAAMKAATGAKLFVSAAARPVVESGRTDSSDPQSGVISDMAPVAVDGILSFEPGPNDIVVGTPTQIMSLTAHFTPGHTNGGTSWSWRSCERKSCVTFAYVDSLTAVSRDGYRFTDHPERVAPFRETFSRVEQMQCDILVTPHPGVSNLFPRLAGLEPLIDASACRRLADTMRARLDERLAKETGQ